jgi:GNAT superfamily N-acetyltransferase
MMTDDQRIAADFQRLAFEALARSGFYATMDGDLSNWVDVLRCAPQISIINPTFDPSQSDLRTGSAFWIEVRDANGTVATITNRLFEIDDYVEEVAAGRVHYADPRPDQVIRVRPDVPWGHYNGRVGNAGGLWVHPRARKQGLSWLLPRLMRAYSVQLWNVDRHCALVFGDINDAGLVQDAYGFPDVHLLSTDYFPPSGRAAKVYLIHIHRKAIVEQFLEDNVRMSANRDKHMRDIATIVSKRKHQAAVA